MSTAIPAPPPSPSVEVDTTRPGIPFGRLVKVEWRKLFDTRASRWLAISTGILMLVVVAIALIVVATNDNTTLSATDWFSGVMISVLSILLPVFAILSVTGEWTQRSHLTLFTLEPHRARVVTAKLVVVTIFALVVLALAFVLSALGNVAGAAVGGYDAVWNYEARDLIWTLVAQLAYFIMAFGIATVVLSTPMAIVLFYVIGMLLPIMVYQPLVYAFDWLANLVPFIDFNFAIVEPMTGKNFVGDAVDVGAGQYLRVLSPILLWNVLPLVFGYARIKRDEVK